MKKFVLLTPKKGTRTTDGRKDGQDVDDDLSTFSFVLLRLRLIGGRA